MVCMPDVGQSMPDVKALLALKNPRLGTDLALAVDAINTKGNLTERKGT